VVGPWSRLGKLQVESCKLTLEYDFKSAVTLLERLLKQYQSQQDK
jgi:hypothetical protein